jgi:hypothetical protein
MVLVIFFTLPVQCTERSEADYEFSCHDTEYMEELLVVHVFVYYRSASYMNLLLWGFSHIHVLKLRQHSDVVTV